MATVTPLPRVDLRGDQMVVHLVGAWSLEGGIPDVGEAVGLLAESPARLGYESGELGSWDASLLTYLVRLGAAAEEAGERFSLERVADDVAGVFLESFESSRVIPA